MHKKINTNAMNGVAKKAIPSPKFDTKNVSEILRELRRYKVTTKTGTPYRRVFIKGDLNTINTAASREIGVGAYTIRHYSDGWYYVGLKEVVLKSKRGWVAGRTRSKPLKLDDLLTQQWTSADYYEGEQNGHDKHEAGSGDSLPAQQE